MIRRILAVALALSAGVAGVAVSSVSAQEHTVLIRRGHVMDGSGNPWIIADVLIRGDRIVAVGDLGDVSADDVVDATGLYVTPGFIDTHTHAGPGLATPELSAARPLLAEGITSILANPDGGGPVDLAAQRQALEKDGLGVNVGQLVSQGSVREAVMQDDDRDPTPAEMERMKALVKQGMEEGAFGMSSGTFYVPGFYSKPAEIEELAKILTPYGAPYQSHIRDESDYTVGLVAAVDEVINVGRVAHIPAILTHVKALGPHVWGYGEAIVKRVERARAAGVQVFADQYPYTASSTSLSAALLPRWSQAGGRDSLRARMARPADMARIREAMVDNLERRGGADRIQFASYRADPSIEGLRLSDVAARSGKDPVDEAVDLIKAGSAGIVSYNMDDDDVETLMAQPWTMTASDGTLVPMGQGVPHPRAYGTFPRKIRLYALEKHTITLESAIRSMTSLPAWVWKIPDRGVLRAGAFADVVVFDLAKVKDTATYTDPHQLAEGMVWVFVNGQPAIARGQFTGTLAGKVLRKGM
ncbi:MAG: amidohydrolase family protein [Gemmatimonadetes bacterium]|nr:amidohydrolase family protein [Gemmatimonadota bacterium]